MMIKYISNKQYKILKYRITYFIENKNINAYQVK